MKQHMQGLIINQMDRVRGLIYKAGFRPKWGSIWHSPSREMLLIGRQCMDGLRQELEKTILYGNGMEEECKKNGSPSKDSTATTSATTEKSKANSPKET